MRLRTLTWPRFAARVRGQSGRPLPLVFPAKDPTDVLDYGVDLTAWLKDAADDLAGITVAGVTRAPWGPGILALWGADDGIAPGLAAGGDLTLSLEAASPTTATFWAAAGTAGFGYRLALSLTTAAGRALTIPAWLPVVDRGGAPLPTGYDFLGLGAGDVIVVRGSLLSEG